MAKKETTNGDLRTPVVFYSAHIDDGLDGRDIFLKPVYKAFAEIYNPSMKDMEIASGIGVKASLTIKIRDPLSAYYPKGEHFVEVKDGRLNGQKWKIVDRRPDFTNRNFLIVVLGGVADV